MSNLKLSAPWFTYAKEVIAMFERDPEIKIDFNENTLELKMYVDNSEKAEAISQLLPEKKYIGGSTVKITVIPANKMTASSKSIFDKAFEGNPAFSRTETIEGIFTNPLTYVVFENKVVQFWNDDLSDVNGLCSTLYENIAANIFEGMDNVNYCTEKGEDTVKKGV